MTGFWCDRQQEMDFFSGGSVIMGLLLEKVHLLLSLIWVILVKNILMMDLFQLLSSPDVNWWTGVVWIIVDYCDVFISCLDSHSDGTHSLQSIHCLDTDAVTHFYKSDEETNSSTSWMVWEWAHCNKIFILGELL